MEATLNSPLGRTILGTNTVTIGSTSDNQLVLRDDNVGSRHAEIRPEGQGHSIIDLGSNTGTFVNGQRVYPNIPQVLQNGDSVRIGNTTLTYEMTSGSSIAPTVYASPGQSGNLGGYTPTVMTSSGSTSPTAYGASSPSNDLYSTPAPPPMTPPPPASNPYSVSDPYGGSTPKKRGRRGLWIALGAVGAVIVVIIVVAAIAFRGPSITPTQAFQAFCAAYKAHNAQAIYNMYTASARQQLGINSVNDLQQTANAATDCTVSKVDDNADTGLVTVNYQNIGKLSFNDTLVNEDNTWKIAGQKPISSPTRTLYTYCVAILKGDYQTAYNLYTQTGQSPYGSEAKYAASFNEKASECALSNVDDAAGKGTVTMKFSSGPQTFDETLTNENGTWKINNEQVHSTPTVTLTNYCNALKQGDYQTAYNQYNSDLQSTITEAQYAAQFNGVKVTDCSSNNIDDTAGTATVTYTFDNGKTLTADYVLVQDNTGTWKIKSEKAHQ